MVREHFASQEARLAVVQAEYVPTVEVFAVNRQVLYGEQIRPEDLVAVRYVEQTLPEGAFRTEAELFPEGPDQLRTVLRQMEPNEPVLAVKVTEPGEDAGLTSRLADGMRAFAISVDVASGVSGFLRPGDRVDVYWSGSVGERGEVTQLIESGLRIVAIDQTADDNIAGAAIASTVTVEVTPQQVAALAQAQSTGSLSLSLVGQGDATLAEAIEVDQRTLLGIVDAPVRVVEAAPPAPQVCTRRERRGTEVLEIPTPCLATN
jgi:pilus assembly protein CpaB